MLVVGMRGIQDGPARRVPEQQPQRRLLGEDRDLDPREPAQVMPPGGEQQPAAEILGNAIR